jgi:hypothetical protein
MELLLRIALWNRKTFKRGFQIRFSGKIDNERGLERAPSLEDFKTIAAEPVQKGSRFKGDARKLKVFELKLGYFPYST